MYIKNSQGLETKTLKRMLANLPGFATPESTILK
jgi:hypothetical protein